MDDAIEKWGAKYTLSDHLYKAFTLKAHIRRVMMNTEMLGRVYDPMIMWPDMAIHNAHLNLARKMQGADAVFSLNEMEKRRMTNEPD